MLNIKKLFLVASLITFFIAVYFGSIAYMEFMKEDMDEVYLNVSYCALFLSFGFISLQIKENREKYHRER
ncbi:protein YpmT [Bacillus carboniphilus]|uniref:Protein YpmT n=1 Tax=Bacillus carboniphilus TaxID=86663 RepID=A0ABY9K0D1_9BACI|nr:protein YpmT [Bacillus carboniphilus]WLR43310.1 protein YpmT [Bacillus carboniphilus]